MADRKPLDRVIDRASETLATLASVTALIEAGPVITRNFVAAMWQGSVGVTGWTTGDGPLLYGIMDADLSLPELEEYLKLEGPLSTGDRIALERSTRPIQLMGVIGGVGDPDFHQKTTIRLPAFREDIGWSYWCYNQGSAAMNTGAVLTWQGVMFGRWLD